MAAARDYRFRGPEGLLAHYTEAAIAFEHMLPKRELRMGPYRTMQDPAENKDIVPGTGFSGDQPDAEEAGRPLSTASSASATAAGCFA